MTVDASLLLGIVIGLATSVVANLLTPLVTRRLWPALVAMQRSGERAQIRQEIERLQAQLDQLERFKLSDREVYIYLFQWLLGIMCSIAVAIGFAIEATISSSSRLQSLALASLAAAVMLTLVILVTSRDFTSERIYRRAAQLEAKIAGLHIKVGEEGVVG